MSMLTLRHLFFAKKAINYVNNTVRVVSSNQIPETPELHQHRKTAAEGIDYLRELVSIETEINLEKSHIRNDAPNINEECYRRYIPISSAYATEFHIGNCGEKAAIAFAHLKLIGIKPLDFFSVNVDDKGDDYHAIVVIGRTTGRCLEPLTWNREAVICDPWDKKAYPAHLYPDKAAFKGTLQLRYRYG
ncbi:hypothetical protein Xbed_01564 [Xenorhabdus beddingii]|uniref:Transglutaminase-like domain-containing protein n=1 Tax=Xenorhabdus beddingii TaxID=40578 RepID=A0A1Y2SNA8_9GAMM|nr:hypothetical protein [Xenorhabdus beddingii]OTA20339.1 hypothetical protein Xbed_01564 [Xenorhabdus beddingii]